MKNTSTLPPSPEQPLVLSGLKHSGKTSLGCLLAKRLHRIHYDSDILLEDYYARQYQSRIDFRTIYRQLGKEGFDQLQYRVLQQFFRKNFKGASVVLSLGGGAADIPQLGNLLHKAQCYVILLEEDLELLFQRILGSGELPPFLTGAPDPFSRFCEISTLRLQEYRSWANWMLPCAGRSLQSLAEEVLRKLAAY